MKRTLRILLIAVWAMAIQAVCPVSAAGKVWRHAQTITGTVSDTRGEPLPGVTVNLAGTANTVSTDRNGKYRITVDHSDGTLRFSFIGLKTEDVAINGRTVIDVSLTSSSTELQEVNVSIGYGTVRKEEITSSVARVNSDQFIKGLVTSPLDLLKGKVAGLAIAHTSGNPVSGNIDIMLRGVSTLSASTAPLVVIDGIPGGSLNSVNPDDIQDINILKDGSAAAIYGTQGTNGVIIINTKKADGGKPTFEYLGYATTESIRNSIPILDAEDLRRYKQDTTFARLNDYGSSTDWLKEVTRHPVSQVHDLSVKGGSKATNYFASVRQANQNGVIQGTDKESLIMHFRINHAMFDDRLRFSFNLSNNAVTDHQVPTSVYANAILRNPTLPIYNDDGSYKEIQNTGINPVGLVNENKGSNTYNQLAMNGKVSVKPISPLELSAMLSYQGDFNEYSYSSTFKSYDATFGGQKGQAILNGGHGVDRVAEFLANYTKKFGDHNLNALAGYTYRDYTNQNWGLDATDFPLDIFGPWNIGSANSIQQGLAHMGSNKYSYKLIAFFGRLNYNYQGKYLLSGSLRREGSSKFGVNNKWGLFPAVSAGWHIAAEPFMKSLTFINDLKLRAGYGVTGTAPDAPYLSLVSYRFDSAISFYNNGQFVNALVPASNPNPNLKWETKKEYNIGLDFAMFNSRFTGSLDIYRRRTDDLLYAYSVPVPPNVYNQTIANVGSIQNQGIEFAGNVAVINKDDFNWSVSGNVSYNTNKVISLSNDVYKRDYLNVGDTGPPMQTYTHRIESGQALGNFYGWTVEGLRDNGTAWQVAGAGNNQPGEEQKSVIGNGMPKVFSGLSTTLRYKAVDLSVAFRGVFDYQIYNAYRAERETLSWIATYNLPKSAFDKPLGSQFYNFAPPIYSNYYIENGNYVKLDNVVLGYSFNLKGQNILKKARIYVSGQNLAVFTKYKGIDPEIGISGITPGIDVFRNYPNTRLFTLGANLTF